MLKQKVLVKKISRVKTAHSKSPSVRVTVPQEIANELDLKADDVVEWDTFIRNGEKFAEFRKMK